MNRINIAALFVCICLLYSCKEQEIFTYTDSNAPAPAKVTDITFSNTPGGAKIVFKAPSDYNLLYVKAVYERNPGEFTEAKTSVFNDTIKVDGFADTLEHEVKIYSIGKNNKASEPAIVKVKPGVPPYITAFRQSDIKETFGGVVASFKNPDEANLTYLMMVDTTGNGDWAEAETYYSSSPAGVFSARGFDTIPTRFAFYVRDRWGHKSDTIIKTLTPIFEIQLDRTLFREVTLPNDISAGHSWSGVSARSMSFLWNNVWNNANDCFHTKPSTPALPQWFTFDLGRSSILSRLKFYHRAGAQGAYLGGDPKAFEIWGSLNPASDGSWDSWIKLGTFRSVKPSTDAKVTAEDTDFAVVRGEDIEFPPGIPPVKYIRWKTTETWGGFQYMFISELQFWGSR